MMFKSVLEFSLQCRTYDMLQEERQRMAEHSLIVSPESIAPRVATKYTCARGI